MARRSTGLMSRVEVSVLLAVIIVAGGLWGFVELSELARDTHPHAFDTQILLAFRTPGDLDNPIGPRWLEEAMRDVTALGSTVVLTFVIVGTVGFLALTGSGAAAGFILLAVAGGQVLSSALKLGIERPRPDLVSHLAEVFTASFPSGHAMLSAVTYLTLGSLLARIAAGRAVKIYILFLSVLATFAVGVSRVYLGVHWPSDVLGGWCAGAAWAMLCWLAARWRRGRADHPANAVLPAGPATREVDGAAG